MTSQKEYLYIQRIAELEEQVAKLIKVNAQLADKVVKLSKNSSNSSKPPSSDIAKPKPTTGSARQGGQPGHKGISHRPFEPHQIDKTIPLYPGDCDCGYTGCGKLIEKPKIQQTVELIENPIRIAEFHLYGFTQSSRSLMGRQ